MDLYRAVSPQELADIRQAPGFRPGPPSFQGKWFAEVAEHAAAWGRLFYRQTGLPFHIVVVDVPRNLADRLFRLPSLDNIGPARFADPTFLPLINQAGGATIHEWPVIALGRP
jgi:hypothetical protein